MADQLRVATNPITELTSDGDALAYETAGSIRLETVGQDCVRAGRTPTFAA